MRSHSHKTKKVNNRELEFELERALALSRARSGILNFTLYTKASYRVNWHHRILCQKLNDFAMGNIKRLMVFMPPRHGKSELVSRRLPAYLLGLNPDTKIISASHTASLASAMNRDVQRIIDGEEYRELFPETRLTEQNHRMGDGNYLRNSEVFEIPGYEGLYRCAGVGGAIAGHGGDFLLLDDPIKNQEEADSLVYRDKLMDWYSTTFSSRAEKDAGILITTTRWHEDDLAGRLLQLAKNDPEADQWEMISFPSIKEAGEIEFDPRKEGEALWPWKYPSERLKGIRATQGTRYFNALHQQRPSSEEGDLIKREWMLKRYSKLPELHRGRWDSSYISADLRFKDDKKTGDYVVYEAWARMGAQIYFLGESRGRWSFTESLNEFRKFCARFPFITRKLVENKANGPALENVLRTKISGIILVEPEGSKTARVNAVTPLWEGANVNLPSDCVYPDIKDIIEEWVNFGPGCKFDDRTDTMSQALLRFQTEIQHNLRDLTKW